MTNVVINTALKTIANDTRDNIVSNKSAKI